MPTDDLSRDQRTAVESFVTDWLSDNRIPGAALAIVDGDDLVFAEGFGARTLEENEPATPDTLFGFGSCSKSFTAAAVMQLVERSDLAVSDAVNDYLPHLVDAPGDPVTIRELLSHTSGLPSDGSAGPLITRPLGIGHIEVPISSDEDFRRHVQGSVDRRVTDRDAFFYYNSGYTMLSQIVEDVSGQRFADYVVEHLLVPLSMDRSTYSRDAFEATEDRMTPYVKQDDSSTPSEFPFDEFIHGPGGLLSSVTDLANWIRMLTGHGTFDGATVLDPDSVAAMTRPVRSFGTYFDGRDVEYGYGLMSQAFLDDRLISHGGSIAVSNAWFGYLEDARVGVAIACTTGVEAHPRFAGPAILAILQDEDPESVVPYYELTSTLDAVTGEYASYRDITRATVHREGGDLRLELESGLGGEEVLLTPSRVADDVLVCRTTAASGFQRDVRFEFDDGDVLLFIERTRLGKVDS